MGEGEGEARDDTAVRSEGQEDCGVSAPTSIKQEHYAKLVGRQITGVLWEQLDGQALAVLLLDGWDRDGNAATECNAPGPRITTCDDN
jgi:hypothetical protein